MKIHPLFVIILIGLQWAMVLQAQSYEDGETAKLELGQGVTYRIAMQGSVSEGKTPLWLNANRYGLSSLEKSNGYVRGSLIRPLQVDSARRWGVSYGVDLAVPFHYTSHFVVQQAFAEVRWLQGVLGVGSKEYPMELKNNRLSSGSQTLGINARPVPQVRLGLPEYWTLPFFGRWLHLKGHIAYGRMTDDAWQHTFTERQSKYADHVLYHSKAGYLMIGNPDRFCPWSLELGLEMACEFGGTTYQMVNGQLKGTKAGTGLKDFWHALIPAGRDASDGEYGNIEGNQLGSWVGRLNYDAETWAIRFYWDHYFEDHSQMFLLDYDGYGSGEEWQEKKSRRFYVYQLKDIMLGTEINIKYGTWLRDVVLEYLYTKYQSGPYNHDHTMNIPDHVAGVDDYYNHGNYTGWQHWGQVIGNPLYRSPIYNEDGTIGVQNNRFVAFHLGADGQISECVAYRVLASWQEGLGTYASPYTKKRHNVSVMAEATWKLHRQWEITGTCGADFGSILGHNAGFQLTVSKSGLFNW